MLTKKKICAGCNDLTYIYKNIEGKKYCKSCTYKLQPPKQIPKMSEKAKFKLILKKDLIEEDKKFYSRVWHKRFFARNERMTTGHMMVAQPKCENPKCGKLLDHEQNFLYFHHYLEKAQYPEYRHLEENIGIICPDCHNSYHSFPDSVPYLVEKKQEMEYLYS